MLTSKARRRLAHKTSAWGIASTLVFVAGSVLTSATPAQAAAKVAADQTITYDCAVGAFEASTTVTLKVTPPTSVEPSKTGQVTWTLPTTLKAARELAIGTKVEIKNTLTVTGGGTPASLVGASSHTLTTAVAAGAVYTPSPATVTATVTAPSTAGTMTLSPGTAQTTKSLQLVVTPPSGTATTTDCTLKSASPATISIPVQTGGGTGTSTEVEYTCVQGTDTSAAQDVSINVTLTMPTSAKTNEQFSIGWSGSYVSGEELKAPTTGTLSAKIFPYAVLTGISGLTSATGEGATGTITAGAIIPLPASSVAMKSTASTTGTVTVKPGDINFGANAASGTNPMIKCTVQNASELKSYTFSVASGNGSSSTPTPTPTPTPTTTTPRPTKTHTVIVTKTPVGGNGKVTKTPKAGADTGGGGDMGPDGRMFILTGSLLILAAGAGGLVMRRRTLNRG